MNYRYATVLAEKSLGAASTETIDINISDPISRLEIGWKPTKLGTAMLAALAVGISKIELVDGSEVLHSLSGRENQALCIYDRRVPTMNWACLISGAPTYATFGIDFGRYLWDPELAFDPKQFRNPQLKITHNSALLSATTSTHTLEVFAHCFDEKQISPIGFLMAKEYHVWTPSGNDVYEYVDLPTDHVLRQILLRAHLTQKSPEFIVDHFRLDEDNEKRIPIDCELAAYCRRMRGQWAPVHEVFAEYAAPAGDAYMFVTPTDEFTSIAGWTQGVNPVWLDTYVHGGYIQWKAAGGTMTVATVTGYLPHHCYQFPLGRQDQIDDWYDVTKLGSLRARMQAAASCSTTSEVNLILQQLRRY